MTISEAVAAYAGEQLRDTAGQPAAASPVLIEWMIAWADDLGDEDRQQLRRYIVPLSTSAGTSEEEASRRWLVLDWLIRTGAPLWLQAASATSHSEALAALAPVDDAHRLAESYPTIRDAARAAQQLADTAWRLVAEDAQLPVPPAQSSTLGSIRPSNIEPYEPATVRRLETWAAVADAVTTAVRETRTLLPSAMAAAGYRTIKEGELPASVRAVAHAINHSVRAVAWQALHEATTQPTWSWEAPAEARTTEARAALRSIQRAAQRLGHELIERMLT